MKITIDGLECRDYEWTNLLGNIVKQSHTLTDTVLVDITNIKLNYSKVVRNQREPDPIEDLLEVNEVNDRLNKYEDRQSLFFEEEFMREKRNVIDLAPHPDVYFYE